jgi:LacI family transcriptional regulator
LVTIKDVAEKAGVSISTVSHVINGTRFVSDELNQRVLSVMDEMGYYPNVLAQGLRRGGTKTIGLVVPDNSNPFFAEIAHTIEDLGFKNGYSVILCNSHGDLDREDTYLRLLISKQVDGVIFISAGSNSKHLGELTKRNIPIVVVDRELENMPMDNVLVNNENGGYKATRHLLDLGHTNIACVTGPTELTPSAARCGGYIKALQEAGKPVREDYMVSGNFQFQGGEQAISRLFALDMPPTAIFLCNDLMALGAIQALRKLNIKVPEDVSIIGFDDIKLSSITFPALTTIAQPKSDIAGKAVYLLIKRIQTEEDMAVERIILDPTLIERDSCAQYQLSNS